MIRTIEGFRRDDLGDWVAELSCLHGQHVRHQPPFVDRGWVVTAEGRAARVGTGIDCPLCDRGELPDGLHVVRTAGPFDDRSVPRGLLRDHRVAPRTWARLRVLAGSVAIAMGTDPSTRYELASGEDRGIPPEVVHAVALSGDARIEIDFLSL
ncbi:MAG TPA: DUF3565 domain-containing protein [Acidimicrobiales bacterium]